MARFKRLRPCEVEQMRADLSARARAGELRLPDAVRTMRRALGLNQTQFAASLGLRLRQIAEIEQGRANPTARTLNKIASLFDLQLGFVPKDVPTSRIAQGEDAGHSD